MPSPEVRRQCGRIGAHSQHAQHDPRETTKAGTAAFLAKFERLESMPAELLASGTTSALLPRVAARHDARLRELLP